MRMRSRVSAIRSTWRSMCHVSMPVSDASRGYIWCVRRNSSPRFGRINRTGERGGSGRDSSQVSATSAITCRLKVVSSHVDRYHFVVTAGLALCAAAFTIGFVWKQPGLLGVSALLGWCVCVVALAIAVVLLIVLAYRSLRGTARPLLRRSWLGLVNGALGAAAFVYSLL